MTRETEGETVKGGWSPKWMAAGLLWIAATWGTWAAGCWNSLDGAVFRWCNVRLPEPGFWQKVWAITNWRPFDLVAAVLIGVLLLAWMRAPGRKRIESRLAAILVFAVLMLVVREVQDFTADTMGYYRFSPTKLPGVVKLSELVTWIKTKDASARSFPGDHAFVLFAATGFLRIVGGRRRGWSAAAMLVPFAVPRIVVGAHWFTDVAVGGTGMAVATLLLGYATPLAALMGGLIECKGGRFLEAAVRLGRRVKLLPAESTDPERG
ncbi:MAG: phosphatase PAP2 family protein [Luteolibacter sp.]